MTRCIQWRHHTPIVEITQVYFVESHEKVLLEWPEAASGKAFRASSFLSIGGPESRACRT